MDAFFVAVKRKMNRRIVEGDKRYCIHGVKLFFECSKCNNYWNEKERKILSIEEIYEKSKKLAENTQRMLYNINKEHKMTREEARKKIVELYPDEPDKYINILEALGLLKFEKEKKEEIVPIFHHNQNNYSGCAYTLSEENRNKIKDQYGDITIELWPEGLVLWIGGEIKWKSWGMLCS